MDAPDCPLTPALRALLQMAACADTLNTKELAHLLGLKHWAVDKRFERIRESLELRSRHEALMLAAELGWIALPQTPWPHDAVGRRALAGRDDCPHLVTCVLAQAGIYCPLMGSRSGG
jgi:hypothetical protein